MKEEETKHFWVDKNRILWFKDRLVVPKDRELENQILSEAHSSKLSIHPGSSKIYQDIKPLFWWTKMNKEILVLLLVVITVVCEGSSHEIRLASTLVHPWLEMGRSEYGLYLWTPNFC